MTAMRLCAAAIAGLLFASAHAMAGGRMDAGAWLQQHGRQLAVRCGAKRYCKQMRSCKEACDYLIKCGLRRLDRDRDGIPCEGLCTRPCGKRG